MLLITHIIVALLTVVLSSVLFFKPATKLFKSSVISASATLLSGIALTVVNPSHIIDACVIGVIYFSFVSYLILSAKKRLSTVS
jgi:hypothetical protein